MSREYDWFKIRMALWTLILAGLVSWLGRPFIADKTEAINVVVTVFSILAGFIVAVITLLGDPKSLPPGSWKVAELSRDRMYSKLESHKYLFLCYLVTLILIFISFVIKKQMPKFNELIEYAYLFLGTIGFVFSFLLPSALLSLQRERIEHEIEERRNKANINTPDN